MLLHAILRRPKTRMSAVWLQAARSAGGDQRPVGTSPVLLFQLAPGASIKGNAAFSVDLAWSALAACCSSCALQPCTLDESSVTAGPCMLRLARVDSDSDHAACHLETLDPETLIPQPIPARDDLLPQDTSSDLQLFALLSAFLVVFGGLIKGSLIRYFDVLVPLNGPDCENAWWRNFYQARLRPYSFPPICLIFGALSSSRRSGRLVLRTRATVASGCGPVMS